MPSNTVNEGFTGILSKLDNRAYVVCPTICGYSDYRSSIGYDLKRACLKQWPFDCVADKDCKRWYKKSPKKICDLCDSCTKLKWQLNARKRERQLMTEDTRLQRQQASSHAPLEFLCPASKKACICNMQKTIKKLHSQMLNSLKEERLSLHEEQNEEMAELVETIHQSRTGQEELQKIYSEADASEDGSGELLKSTWEQDVSDAGRFFQDQSKTGMFALFIALAFGITVMVSYTVTGNRSNRWSPATIRLGK